MNCPDCDRPIGSNINCPWCGAVVKPPRSTFIMLLSMSAFVVIFTILSCFWHIPPVQNRAFSIFLGFLFGGTVGFLFKYKYPFAGLLPIGAVYLAFLELMVGRTICIHTPYILFLFVFALFFNSLKKKIMPHGSLISRICGPVFIWIPVLALSCCYVSAQGMLLIPALLSLFVILFAVYPLHRNVISFVAVLLFTGFALLYVDFYAYLAGFIATAIVKQLFLIKKKK